VTTIGFIRHGATEWNKEGRLQGQTDTALAVEGIQQAELLAQRLAHDNNWDGIISSDLSRASQTAEIISRQTQIPILGFDVRIRERAFGQLEGTTEKERIERWGEQYTGMELGREPIDALLKRGFALLRELEEQHAGKRILLVTHGGFIAPVLMNLLNDPLKDHLQNTSLSIIERNGEGWSSLLLNCSAHLQANAADLL
jgi:probable phosphoglycerate mutase